jgi:hypothetical protein
MVHRWLLHLLVRRGRNSNNSRCTGAIPRLWAIGYRLALPTTARKSPKYESRIDTIRIDVVRSSGQITAADTVYEYDANGNSTKCEAIKDKAGNVVTQDQLPQSDSETASVEPPSE